MRKVLLTGSNGFVGREIAKGLLDVGYEITGLGRGINRNDGLDYYNFDLSSDYQDFAPSRTFDVLIHAAARNPSCRGSFYDYYRDNIIGSDNAVKFAQNHNVKKIIFLQGVSSYGAVNGVLKEDSPHVASDNYGISKFIAEKLIKDSGISSETYILPGVIGYGCNAPYIVRVAQKLSRDEDVYCYNCDGLFNNVVYVQDVVQFIIKRLNSICVESETFLLGCSELVTVRDMIDKLARKLHSKSNIVFEKDVRGGFYLDISRAEANGFTSVSMDDIIRIVCQEVGA